MEPSEYLKILQRQWRLVASVALLTVLATAALTALTPKEYRAQAQIFISTASGDTLSDLAQGSNFAQRQIATYADIISTPIVLDPVVQQSGLGSTEELAARTVAQVPAGTVLINLSVSDRDPKVAADLTNAVAEQFADTVQEIERVDENSPSPIKATVVKPADVPGSPFTPMPARNLLLGLGFGLVLGLAAGFLREVLDKRVRGEADVARVTDKPAIGAIAYDRGAPDHPLVIEIDPHSARSEAFRAIRTNLFYVNPDEPARTLLVTSTVPNEGKSTTSVNLALTMAETGARVCLIEGDLRRPRMLEYMGLESAVGLTDLLVGRVDLEDVLQPYVGNLQVLGCGAIPPNPSELLGSTAMERLLERLSRDFDYVIIDAPPVLAVTDAAVLSTLTDGTIVVVGAGVVNRDALGRALTTLERVEATILGLVLNRVPVKGPDAYSYAYESYAPDLPTQAGRGRAKRRDSRRRSKLARARG